MAFCIEKFSSSLCLGFASDRRRDSKRRCKRLRELLTSSEEENKYKLPSEKEINHQLLSLVHIDDRNFVLESSEQDMLKNAQICIPSESACETDSQTMSIDGGMCLKEEDLSRANQDCDFCRVKCYNIYLAYLREGKGSEGITPVMSIGVLGTLNDSHCDSSSTEVPPQWEFIKVRNLFKPSSASVEKVRVNKFVDRFFVHIGSQEGYPEYLYQI
ncbi:hypothetical protein AVEN_241041-1 [Araneus ventricosus]|uniref:Uncharacterized protein n=1 Tax=Araneus ventricosus TaxID=182803 RepID=A0A4Y2IAG5_ARAVE|nr:hypothetical protein AVEN_241041-1 [Araneus ventricosus]